MTRTRLPLYWRVFAVNASLLTAIALLLIVVTGLLAFNRMLDRLEREWQDSGRACARRSGGRTGRDRPRPSRRGRPSADRRAVAAELDR
jgi:hypothetical protein